MSDDKNWGFSEQLEVLPASNARTELDALLDKARSHVMTPEEQEAQRQSWVRGEMALGEHERGMTAVFPTQKPPTELDAREWRVTQRHYVSATKVAPSQQHRYLAVTPGEFDEALQAYAASRLAAAEQRNATLQDDNKRLMFAKKSIEEERDAYHAANLTLSRERDEYRADWKRAESALAEARSALRDVVSERDTELDMMRCQYPHGTRENKAWHDGVSEAWKRFKVVKDEAKSVLARIGEQR